MTTASRGRGYPLGCTLLHLAGTQAKQVKKPSWWQKAPRAGGELPFEGRREADVARITLGGRRWNRRSAPLQLDKNIRYHDRASGIGCSGQKNRGKQQDRAGAAILGLEEEAEREQILEVVAETQSRIT